MKYGFERVLLIFLCMLVAVEPCIASSRFCLDKFTEISGGNGPFRMLLNSMETVKAKYANPKDHKDKEDAELFKDAVDAVANSLEKKNSIFLAGVHVHIERGKGLRIRLEDDGRRYMDFERRFAILMEGIFYGLIARIRANPGSFQHIDIEGKFWDHERFQRILTHYGFQRASLSSVVRRYLAPLGILASSIAIPFFSMWGGDHYVMPYVISGAIGLTTALITGTGWGMHQTYRLSLDVIPAPPAPSSPGFPAIPISGISPPNVRR